MKTAVILLLLTLSALLLYVFFIHFGCKAPPVSLTQSTLTSIVNEIYDYVSDCNAVPQACDIFIAGRGARDLSVDAWGNPIEYSILEKHRIRVVSYGRDGKLGGEGEDADIMLEIDPYDIDTFDELYNGRSFRKTTMLKLTALEEQIRIFYSDKKLPPTSLQQVVEGMGRSNDRLTVDGWAARFSMKITMELSP